MKALSDEIKKLTNGNGADVVYDPVGGDFSEAALRATNWAGRFVVVGFASGPIPRIPQNLELLKRCQIVGVFWGGFVARYPKENQQNINELLALFGAGKIKPLVSKVYKLSETAQAIEAMAARKVKGKIVIVP
jgi:NADPH2:quinone reductase